MYDWDQLRRAVSGGRVLLPGDDHYEDSLKRWSTTAEKRAAVVVMPTNVEEVSATVKFAVANSIPLTVCGGGHSTSGSSSSMHMVISLRFMRAVRVTPDAMTVSFEGGCIWEDVDNALGQFGLATVGGVVNHTGCGGLTLGGGHGWLTARHGLTIDNLLSVQMVLADGSIVEASEEENSDLFWAVRGAGAQFGVVTRFTSRAHKQGKVWSGVLNYSEDKLPQLVAVANDLHDKHNKEGHCLALGIGYGLDGVSRGFSVVPCFQGDEADAKVYFSKLLEIEALSSDVRMLSVAQVSSLFNPIFDHGIRRLMGSSNVTMPLDPDALSETANMLWEFCDSHKDMGLSTLTIEIFSTDKLREVRLDATAYANRGNYYDAGTTFGWLDPALDQEIRKFNRELCDQIRRTNGYRPDAGSDGPVGKYINIEADDMSPGDAFGSNAPRLKELKKKYDPSNVFHKWHGVGV